jgi:putative transposase
MSSENHTGFKFRLLPVGVDDKLNLHKALGANRFIWNHFLSIQNKIEELEWSKPFNQWLNPKFDYFELAPQLTQLKKEEGNEWLKETFNATYQQTLMNLNQAFSKRDQVQKKIEYYNNLNPVNPKKTFRKDGKPVGHPKFKAKRDCKDSITYLKAGFSYNANQQILTVTMLGSFKIQGNQTRLRKAIRKNADCISRITLSIDKDGRIWVAVLVSEPSEIAPFILPDDLTGVKIVGVDLGIKSLVALSNGICIENPKWLRNAENRLKTLQQEKSKLDEQVKKAKKSKTKVHYFVKQERDKLARRLRKAHERVVNLRNHFIHQITSDLVKKYDVICVENLNVTGMMKNRKLSKSIQDASWGRILSQLDYKCKKAGKLLLQCGRFDASSKLCSSCGNKKKELTLDIRTYECESCNLTLDRDVNAALNIINYSVAKHRIDEIERKKKIEEDLKNGIVKTDKPKRGLFGRKKKLVSTTN